MNEREESASELFEAHSDSAMIFDLHEKAFNKMPFFVVTEIGVPRINWIRLWRNTEISVMVRDVFTVFPWTIDLVSKNSTAGNIELFKTFLHHDSVMYLSTGEFQHQRVAESIHYRVDFGGSSPSVSILRSKPRFLVGMTGVEPAWTCSQTLKTWFFTWFYGLFGAFASGLTAFVCSSRHKIRVVRSRKWSRMWSATKPA